MDGDTLRALVLCLSLIVFITSLGSLINTIVEHRYNAMQIEREREGLLSVKLDICAMNKQPRFYRTVKRGGIIFAPTAEKVRAYKAGYSLATWEEQKTAIAAKEQHATAAGNSYVPGEPILVEKELTLAACWEKLPDNCPMIGDYAFMARVQIVGAAEELTKVWAFKRTARFSADYGYYIPRNTLLSSVKGTAAIEKRFEEVKQGAIAWDRNSNRAIIKLLMEKELISTIEAKLLLPEDQVAELAKMMEQRQFNQSPTLADDTPA